MNVLSKDLLFISMKVGLLLMIQEPEGTVRKGKDVTDPKTGIREEELTLLEQSRTSNYSMYAYLMETLMRIYFMHGLHNNYCHLLLRNQSLFLTMLLFIKEVIHEKLWKKKDINYFFSLHTAQT